MGEERVPLINPNPTLQSYYKSLESQIGYWAFLGNTRHFGFYEPGSRWPFPINAALRRMENRLYNSLQLQPGAKVLDAGCGFGHVAVYMASKGLQVCGIDVVDEHVQGAQRAIQSRGFEKEVTVRLMDYHHLDPFADQSFDGLYTMETLVHATDARKAVAEFFRVLKPGGSIALHEYEHPDPDTHAQKVSGDLIKSMEQINRRAAMPSNESFKDGVVKSILEEQGFQDVVVEDLTANIKPLVFLFFIVAYIPYLLIQLLGLQAYFVNTQAGVEGYRVLKLGLWRYVSVRAKKPSTKIIDDSGARERRTY